MSDEPSQPQDQPTEPQPDQPQDLEGQWRDANEGAKTNVGSEHTDDEARIGEAGSRAHNERIGEQQ